MPIRALLIIVFPIRFIKPLENRVHSVVTAAIVCRNGWKTALVAPSNGQNGIYTRGYPVANRVQISIRELV